MPKILRRNLLWVFYLAFLLLAALYGSREPFLTTDSPYVFGKVFVFTIFAAFLAYSLYCSIKENFFKSVVQVNRYWWGLQIGLDLYVSVTISLCVIYLNEGSLIVTLLWAVPVLIFANLAILPYILLNYASLVGNFT